MTRRDDIELGALTKGTSALLIVGLMSLTMLIGCSGGGGEESSSSKTAAKSAEPAAEPASPVVDPATASTVTGRVVFEGTAPEMPLIDVSSEMTCHSKSEDAPVYSQSVVVNGNGTLRYAFVYVKEGLGDMKFPVPAEPVVLDQTGCTYVPHVFGIQTKQSLLIKNSDEGVLHNIHTLSKKGNGFNFGMPKVMETTKQFKKPEMVRIKCDVHGWMSAYAGVVDHPYYGVTGEDGTFELAPLPPGEYVIEAWHEEYGVQTQTVTVAATETKEITFTFKPGS